MTEFLVFIAALGLAAQRPETQEHPRWAVRVSSDGEASFFNEPNCHPLEYFVKDISHLNYDHALLHIQPDNMTDEARSLDIGTVAGYKIEEVTHVVGQFEFS